MNLTKEQVIEEIKMGKSLKDFPKWKDSKEVVLEAVKRDDSSLKYASDRLRDDKGVVLEAISYGWALEYASEQLRDNKEVVLEAVKEEGWALEYASKRLKDDKEIALKAVKQNGYNLEFASERLRDDKEVVLEAIKDNNWALKYASNQFKKELLPQVLTSLNYKGSLEPIEMVKHSGNFLSLLTTEEQNDKEIVLEAIIKNVVNIEYASQEIRDKIKNNDPVRFLEKWIKSEKLDKQLGIKEKSSKIKI